MVERLVHSIVRLTLRHRWFSLAFLAVFTVFFAYEAVVVRMYSKFSDLLPQAHPYVAAYNHFREIFGTANERTLKKIRPVVGGVAELESQYQALSAEALRANPE